MREKQAETVLHHFWEDMTNKSGFIPESCGITHRFIMKQLAEQPVLALRECGKETSSWEGFHFQCLAAFRVGSPADISSLGSKAFLNLLLNPLKDWSENRFPKRAKNTFWRPRILYPSIKCSFHSFYSNYLFLHNQYKTQMCKVHSLTNNGSEVR